MFTFFNHTLEGVLYASEMTNTNPAYQYSRQESLEVNSEFTPELVDISNYGAVFFCRPDRQSNVTYKHYEIGFGRTLLQFTWMTPHPEDETLNREIEAVLESAEIV